MDTESMAEGAAATEMSAKRRRGKLGMLMAAAMAIPGIAIDSAEAQNITPSPVLRVKYGEYRDYQRSGDRMTVHAPMLQFRSPLTESVEFEGTMLYESMSGASPLYLSTLSGASGLGIHDNRRSGDVRFTKYFEQFSVALGGSVSNEDDYDSRGFLSEGRFWTEDKNTVVALAAGADFDDIGSTNDPSLDEERATANFLVGLTQIIDPVSAIQINLTYSTADGYLSDPYKTFDHRPESRESIAWLTRYLRYIEATEGSVHIDYRLFKDTFDIWAHTFELTYYQPLDYGWMIRPSIRYYSQDRADFFSNGRLPANEPTTFYSADQRLSTFGEWGAGLKVIKEITETLSADVAFQIFQQRSGFYPGGDGSDNIEPFYGYFLIFGITKTF